MSLFSTVRQRRVIPWIGAYALTGFVVLEAADQLASRGFAPDLAYTITLIIYLAGFLFVAVLAWYHGEKGPPKPTGGELWLLSTIVILTGWATWAVVQDNLASARVRAELADAGLRANRIAVRYLEDRTGGELEYLADGLTEAVIGELAQVGALDVVSRHAVAPYRDRAIGNDSIARAVDVGTVVDGSVERAGDDIRATLRVVEGVSGADFQRTTLALPEKDLLALRDSVAVEVARFLREWLGEEIRLRERRAETESVAAWASMQRGERALKESESALVAGDSEGAWAAFGRADSLMATTEQLDQLWMEPTVSRADIAYRRSRLVAGNPVEALEWIDTGLSHAQRALAGAPGDAGAFEARGTLRYFRWLLGLDDDADERELLLGNARDDLERAVSIDPSRASAHSALSHLYYQVDDVVSAVLSARRAYEEDAYLAVADLVLWRLYLGSYDLGQFAQARRWCDEGGARFSEDYRFADCQLWMMLTEGGTPDVDQAWRRREELLALVPATDRPMQERLSQIVVGGVIARAGLADSATAVLEGARATPDIDPDQEILGYEAAIRSITGERDIAVELLKRYVAANPGHSFEVGGDLHWWWRGLADHPEFRAVRGGR